MMDYLGSVASSIFSVIFVVFLIASLGYLMGGIKFKGISFGSAGVLAVAILYGIIASYIPSFSIGNKEIILFDGTLKANYNLISSLGTPMFLCAVGLTAGPKFFRTFNKNALAYIFLGILIITIGSSAAVLFYVLDNDMTISMAMGLLTGALTSTPGLSAAKEVVGADADVLTAGYSIAYLFGVLGVVFFVQILPKLLHIDIEEERKNYIAANTIAVKPIERKMIKLDTQGFFPFALAIALGCIIGAIKVPGINFSLGTSGGSLLGGLIIGHFGHIGFIDCRSKKETLSFFRELGLILFLIGAGVPGGINFINNVKFKYFIYGGFMTLLPMISGFLIAKYGFKLSFFNSVGSITGGMTSTPALGALIATAGTDEVASAYVATYPIALITIVIATKIIIMISNLAQ